jgi:hypothetical protein
MSELSFDADESSKNVNFFIRNYLQIDGIFVIRTLIFRAGIVFATELLADLYSTYFGIEERLKRSSSDVNMAQHDQADAENKKNINRIRKRKGPKDVPLLNGKDNEEMIAPVPVFGLPPNFKPNGFYYPMPYRIDETTNTEQMDDKKKEEEKENENESNV